MRMWCAHVNPVYEMRFCGWSAHVCTGQMSPTNVCASVKHVLTCEWGCESVERSSHLRTGPLTANGAS